MKVLNSRFPVCPVILICLALLGTSGCGSTKANVATEQLLTSDAVDGAVAKIDFTPLMGQKVYFDTTYINDYKGIGFVNSAYVVSSLRQQMIAAGLLLQDSKDVADFVIEGRIGALGADAHEIVYGIPATNNLSAATTAASTVAPVPPVPGIPELSIARRNDQTAAAKIAVFAYERESKHRVWQSGISTARSTAKDVWLFGAGPFQRGTIYDGGLRFAGSALNNENTMSGRPGRRGAIAAYKDETIFESPAELAEAQDSEEDSKIQQVSSESEEKDEETK